MNLVERVASRVNALPILKRVSPSAVGAPSEESQQGYLKSQRLALQAAREIKAMLDEGWTEKRTARLMDTWLRDNGVHNFFHHSFVWFGDRTRFVGVKSYGDYAPGNNVLQEGDSVILDVAPIVDSYISDIGFSYCLGNNPEYERGQKLLKDLREKIPQIVNGSSIGREACATVDELIRVAGFDNIHETYPFKVLGHRVHQVKDQTAQFHYLNFGWQSFWALLSRGLFGQLMNENHEGPLAGLWAIEPHIGGKGWGAKFEEILVVDESGARWLEQDIAQSSVTL
jgi:Xaa-Pro aminopeptidase